ncbi:MAG: hypothetical protein EPN88_17245 [Bacteroidetes bacterium]|nr:MAG: hypothetical protein EPN88_17245 [Bacteroidota bacterium]
MESCVNQCVQWLIEDVKNNRSARQVRKTIIRGFLQFNRKDYNEEERKLIAFYLDDLSSFFGADIDFIYFYFTLNLFNAIWLSIVTRFVATPKPIMDRFINICTKCGSKLVTFTFQKVPDNSEKLYSIVKCKICGEYNLIEVVTGLKEIQHIYYDIEEQYSKQDLTLEQANRRLEQIKNFR